jgi:ABC-type sugar transport system ATPase subunit
MAVLQVSGLAKSYGSTRALQDLTLSLESGEIHALCGHNGAGKSTLVKLVAGIERPDEGEIFVNGEAVSLRSARDAERLGIALVQQELSVLSTLTVEENVLLGGQLDRFFSRPYRHRARVRELLALVGLDHLDPSASGGALSAGERQLVEIARAVGRNARLLILDEPTATLSDVEIARVFDVVRRLSEGGTAIVFVSHRLGEVLNLCHRATVMRDGALVATRPVSELSRRDLIELMVGSFQTTTTLEEGATTTDAQVVARIVDLAVPGQLRPFSLDVRAGEIVALAGQVGAGASTVLRALGGLQPEARGTITLNERKIQLGSPGRALGAGVHFVSNDRKGEGLFLDHSAAANLIATRLDHVSRWGVIRATQIRAKATALARDIAFDGSRLRDHASTFSGGNQQKLFVGRAIDQKVSGLLLLDEPTRGVDVKGRAEIHQLVRRAAADGNAVIFASTELDEILDLASTVVTMRAGATARKVPRATVDAATILQDMTHAGELEDAHG